MTPQQFKDQFNLLYNNINNNAAPGLNDAEISSFLNKAQDEVVKQHALGAHTNYQLGINQTSKRDVELDTLIKTASYTPYTTEDILSIHGRGKLFTPPNKKILIILSEVVQITTWEEIIEPTVDDDSPNSSTLIPIITPYDVVELSYTQFNKFLSGSYKYPKKGQCWKLRHDNKVELVYPAKVYESLESLNSEDLTYNMVYVELPQQFNLPNTGCALPEVLHMEIVQRAVELAKAAYASQDTNIQLSMGQRSE